MNRSYKNHLERVYIEEHCERCDYCNTAFSGKRMSKYCKILDKYNVLLAEYEQFVNSTRFRRYLDEYEDFPPTVDVLSYEKYNKKILDYQTQLTKLSFKLRSVLASLGHQEFL